MVSLGFTLLNFSCIFLMYSEGNYKTAIFNGIAFGFCFCGYLVETLKKNEF